MNSDTDWINHRVMVLIVVPIMCFVSNSAD